MTELYFKIRPDSKENSFETGDHIIEASVTEEAENGKANAQLLSLIKERTGLDAAIISGHKSRRKKLKIDGNEEELREKLKGGK